ncbi:MAG: hypothetical protein U0798_15920 [Gemmataceae bacterium]
MTGLASADTVGVDGGVGAAGAVAAGVETGSAAGAGVGSVGAAA